MFGLLDQFSADRNAYAPIIYKTLTFALVENYGMDEVREFLLENFISTFQSTPEMPIGILLDPYLKQLQVSDISLCNLPDYHFFSIVSKHPRLGLKNAVQLLDVLGKCCIATPIYIRAIDQPFQDISERFVQVQVMQEFLYQFMNRLVFSFLQSETAQPDFPTNPDLSQVYTHFMTRIVSLQSAQLRNRLTKLLVSANAEYKKIAGKQSAHLLDVLRHIGDPKKLMASADLDSEVFQEFSKSTHSEEPRNSRKLQPKDRVQADIESAKIKREQLKAKILLQEQQKQMAEEKKRRTFKRQFELKIIPANTPILSPAVFDVQKPGFFFDLREESEEDQEGVFAIMRKYTRVLKLLYQKYSSTGYRKKENVSFEKQRERLTLMTEAEMYKLLKDQGVAPRLMSKDVFSSVFKGFCARVQRTELTSVDYDGYYDLVIQVALYVFSKPPKDLSVYPPAVSVKAFFDLLRSASGEQGLSTKFFDEPDPGAGDRDLVRKLNQTLQKDPNSELPDGYKKVTEPELTVTYGIPRSVRIPRAYKMALGVLDELLNSALGIHILEPQFRFKGVVRAQGVLQKQGVKPAIPLNFPPEIKYQVSILVKDKPRDIVMECAQVMDDLIYSVEMWSPVLLSRGHHGHGRFGSQQLNPILRSKDQQAKELQLQREKAERKRQLRRQVVEETLQAEKHKKAKRDKREHRKQRKAEKIQVLELQKREEERKKIRELKEKELRDWYQQKKEVEQNKLMEESLQKEREAGEKARFRKEFLAKERKRLAELSQGQIEKKQKSQEEKSVAIHRLEELKLSQKTKAAQTIIQHRKERDLDRAAKQRISAVGSQPEVTQTLAEFNGSVEVLFTHYSKAAARLDLDPLLAVKALPLPGFKKFCAQFEIVPNLVGSEESIQLFTRLAREERDVEGVLALSQDRFKQALVQLAILGKPAMQQIKGESASEEFGAKGIRDFFSFLMVTQDPKATLVLLRKINEPVLTMRKQGQSVMKGK